NKLVRFYKGTTGLKTGTTSKAGYCVSASAERDGLHLIAVVMGSDNSSDRFEGAKALLNYGFANYKTVTPKYDKTLVTPVNVIKGFTDTITPETESILPITVKAGEENKIEAEVEIATDVEAPVEKGQKIGSVIFKLDGKTLAEYPLTAKEEVRRLTISEVMKRLMSSLSVKA
ncbi:MAG: D-alanyl-D-alanine carboxypeptidase, partial [Acutalibacteraceae bacterium]